MPLAPPPRWAHALGAVLAAPDRRNRLATLALGLAIALLAVGSFWNTLDNPFLLGDVTFIVRNPALARDDVVASAFAKTYWTRWVPNVGPGSYYRPLVVLADALDLRLWGKDPTGFHATNLLLHALTSLLVFGFIRGLTGRTSVGALAAMLFAVHPIHVHAVAYVSGRTSLIEGLFYVLGMYVALGLADDQPSPRRDAGLAACVALALLSKESAVTLPAAAMLLVWSLSREKPWAPAHLRRLALLGLVTGGYLLVRRLVIGELLVGGGSVWDDLGAAGGLLSVAKTALYYLQALAIPRQLSYLPVFVPALEPTDVRAWLGVCVVVLLVAVAIALPRSWNVERVLVAWLLISLLPILNIVGTEYFVKEHLAYVPSVPFCGLLAALSARAVDWSRRVRAARAIVPAVAAAWLIGLPSAALRTWVQNRIWSSPLLLGENVLRYESGLAAAFGHPAMARARLQWGITHFMVGTELARQGGCEEALAHFARAIELARGRAVALDAHYNRARCLFELGRFDAAEKDYWIVYRANPRDATPALRLAALAARRGDSAGERRFLAEACRCGSVAACAAARARPGGG